MPRLALAALAALAACSSTSDDTAAAKAPPTQRQVQEAIASSRLPGSQGVGIALRASDSAAAHAAIVDSASAEP